jgi:predicted porin
MKKSLIALAVMAAAGAASAQSSVTLFGIVDATLQWSKSSGSGNNDVRFRMTHSGYNSSRLGFRGTEDLGGGMSASFWLEATVMNDTGAGNSSQGSSTGGATNGAGNGQGLAFDRRSTVSLAGGWGELRLGRDYTPTFWNLTVFDPFGTNGAGTTLTVVGSNLATRANNSIGYFAPANLGGFYGQVMYAENELSNACAGVTCASNDTGTYYGGRVGYAAGPFNVAASYGRILDNAVNPGTLAIGDTDAWNIAGHWDFGMAKVMAQIARLDSDATENTSWLIGALVPVGAGEIRVAYSQLSVDSGVAGVADADAKRLALGYVHNLSKRTALYTTWAHTRGDTNALASNGGATGVGGRSNVIDVGIRHSF